MSSTPERSTMGLALIGAGMIGPTQVAALSALRDRVRLDAIVARRPERVAGLARQYSGEAPLLTADLSAVTENPDIDAVIVATPPSVRTELISELAAAGKHILLEKPVARTTEEAVAVVEICERAGVTLGVVFQHRMRAASLAAKRFLADGALGQLGNVEIVAPLWRDQAYYDEPGRGTYARDGGGVLLTQAIHTIDLALSLTGPVSRVQAMTATTPLHRMESEDLAVAGLRFANGAAGSLVVSTASFPQREEVIGLHFKRASLRVGKESLQIDWRDGRHEVLAVAGVDVPHVDKHKWHAGIIADFVAAIAEGRPPLVGGRAALAAHRLISAIETSSRTGRPVDVAV